MKITKRKTYILLFLILAFGFFLRTINIDNAPPGVYPDEAVNGMDALNAESNGQWQWFYEANNGREGLFMNLIAVMFKYFGVSAFTLRFPSMIFGTLTILGTFLLTREIFGKERLALIASFLVATSFWAINFSRISFRANMLPFILVFSFYYLWKAINVRQISKHPEDSESTADFRLRQKKSIYKSLLYFIIAGLFFGLGLHSYIAFRIAPLILAVIFLVILSNRNNFLRENWFGLVLFIVFTAIVSTPMLFTFYAHPEYITSRTGNVSILNPEVNQGHLLTAFLKSFGLSIIKYDIWGDQNWRHNYPPYAILDPITGIAFTFGLIYVLIKFIHLWSLRLFRKMRNNPRLEVYSFLLLWFFVMLVPEFMTAEGNPHALRSIGTLPVVFIFSALTFEYFLIKSDHYTSIFKKLTVSVMVLILLAIGAFNSVKYHLVWAKQPEAAQAFDKNLIDMVGFIKSQPEDKEIFVVIEVMQRIPLQVFDWNRPNLSYYYPAEIDGIDPTTPDPIIMITDYNEEILNKLQIKFPKLTLEEKKDEFGMSYYILR